MDKQDFVLDPAIRDWVLVPIMLVMVLIGVLRHYVTILMGGSGPSMTTSASTLTAKKVVDLKAIREAQALQRARLLRVHANSIPYFAFQSRRRFLVDGFDKGTFLKSPPTTTNTANDTPAAPANPMGDPQQMDLMMDGMKKNMVMMVPNMLIMGWVNFFFSGFVLSTFIGGMKAGVFVMSPVPSSLPHYHSSRGYKLNESHPHPTVKLPFPLTLRFKSMLQRGIETSQMDVAWVSSLSWYFLNLFGLKGIFGLILGEENGTCSYDFVGHVVI